MEKDNGFNPEKVILTEDNRKIKDESIKKISNAGQSWSSFGGFIGLPEINLVKKVKGEPLEKWTKKSRNEKSEIIYCTWMGAGKNVNFPYIEKQLKAFKRLNIHPTVFIIDDGWATKNGDWSSVNKQKFPNGLEQATNLIKESNIKPWLWISPLHVEKSSELAKNHPDWFIQRNGQPISYWYKNTGFGKTHYLLDLSNDEAVNYLDDVAQKIKNWGFEGVKTDFLSSLYLIKEMTQEDKQSLTHKTMEIFKEKDLEVLASGSPFNAAVGVADIIRLSNDSGIPSFKENAVSKITNSFLSWRALEGVKKNRKLIGKFINIDPDMYYSTNVFEKTKRNLFEAQKLSVYRAGCLTLGDDFSKLSEVKAEPIKELIKKFYRAQKSRKFFTSKRINQKS